MECALSGAISDRASRHRLRLPSAFRPSFRQTRPRQGESRVSGPKDGDGNSIWNRLRQRKLVQWGIPYVAGAWGLLQGLAYVSGHYDWPRQFQQIALLLLLPGFPIALTLARYQRDRLPTACIAFVGLARLPADPGPRGLGEE